MEHCYPLFGKIINLEKEKLFIHGLVHDNPLVSISKEFKRNLNELFKGYNVICEDGISNWIENTISFNETDYFKFNKLTIMQYFSVFRGYFYNRFIKKIQSSELMLKVQQMETTKELEEIRKELFTNYSPEPDGMNYLMNKYGVGTIDNPKGELPQRIKRYAYEAKESLRYVKENNLNELHIIVGCAHELPLEYLLRNQEILKNLQI